MSSAVQAFEDNEMAVSETSSNITEEKKFYRIYSIKNYYQATTHFINNNYEEYELEDIIKLISSNNNYHFRTKKNTNYILFGDVDGYKENNPITFFNLLCY